MSVFIVVKVCWVFWPLIDLEWEIRPIPVSGLKIWNTSKIVEPILHLYDFFKCSRIPKSLKISPTLLLFHLKKNFAVRKSAHSLFSGTGFKNFGLVWTCQNRQKILNSFLEVFKILYFESSLIISTLLNLIKTIVWKLWFFELYFNLFFF